MEMVHNPVSGRSERSVSFLDPKHGVIQVALESGKVTNMVHPPSEMREDAFAFRKREWVGAGAGAGAGDGIGSVGSIGMGAFVG